jgi:hypothetical protein
MKVPSPECQGPSSPTPNTWPGVKARLLHPRPFPLGTRNSLVLFLGLLLTLTAPLSAQDRADSLLGRPSPFPVKYGKWVLLAASIGMGLQAASAHRDADRAYDRLDRYCTNQPAGCAQDGSGRYLDPVAEDLYQSSLSHDRHARNWLFGGEAALVGAAGLFVWELTRPKSLPRNIPFEPQIRWTGRETRLGVSAAF